MSLTIEDEAVLAAIHRLAERTGRTPEDAVRHAVRTETASLQEPSVVQRAAARAVSPQEQARRRAALKEIQDKVASWPKTGLKADKAFYDSLNDDDR